MFTTDITKRLKFARQFCLVIFAVIFLALTGCGAVSPALPDPAQDFKQENSIPRSLGQHILWGFWDVKFNPEVGTFEILPGRNIDAHWNVTSLIKPDKCAGYLTFGNVFYIDADTLSVTVTISHPFSGNERYDGFDVKGVVLGPSSMEFLSGTISSLLKNPDGYTRRWSSGQWAEINPFIDFAIENSDRRFESGGIYSREILLNLPDDGPLEFSYVIDACWLPPEAVEHGNPSLSEHCNEAYDVKVVVEGKINALPGSLAEITVEFSDWQNDGDETGVEIEIPGLINGTNELFFTGKTNPYTYTGFISNENFAPAGSYTCLISIKDALNNPETDNLTTFTLAEVVVTSETPSISGIEIFPETLSLPESGSSEIFTVYKIYTDGSRILCSENIDWSISGIDLNGHTLAEINENGKVTRLTSKWWGGTASVRAIFSSYETYATAFCEDPFADVCDVEFGELNEAGSEYTNPESFAGPPNGGGGGSGGLNVCSLGYGGVAILEFTDNVAMNGDGIDLIIYENPMITGAPCEWNDTTQLTVWNENAAVEVSMDGIEWFRFPVDYDPGNETCVAEPWMNPSSYEGLAGNYPVYAGVDETGMLKNGIDPTDFENSGGDGFDLDDVGLPWCRYVRVIDTGDPEWPWTHMQDDDGDFIFNYGNMSPLGSTENLAGFDGDSVAACHSEPINTIL